MFCLEILSNCCGSLICFYEEDTEGQALELHLAGISKSMTHL